MHETLPLEFYILFINPGMYKMFRILTAFEYWFKSLSIRSSLSSRKGIFIMLWSFLTGLDFSATVII